MNWISKGNLGKAIMLFGFAIASCQTVLPAQAYWADGQELLKWCTSKASEPEYIKCQGYIQGHMDTALIGGAFKQRFICLPEDVTFAKLRESAVEYLKSHAVAKQKVAPLAILDALHDVFPCKSSK